MKKDVIKGQLIIGGIILLLALIVSICKGQENTYHSEHKDYMEYMPFTKEGRLEVQVVVEVDSATAEELYTRAKYYIAESYGSSEVIDMDDANNSTLIAKAYKEADIYNGMAESKLRIWYTFKLECKDKKYRLSIYNIWFQVPPPYTSYKSYPEQLFTKESYNMYSKKEKGKRSIESQAHACIDLINNLRSSIYKALREPTTTDEW